MSSNALTGVHSIQHTCVIFADIATCFAGELPKELPVSLEVLSLGEVDFNTNKFTGGIPSEWGALTNLKKLKIVACDLDGEMCISYMCCTFADIFTCFAGELPKELGNLVNLKVLELWANLFTSTIVGPSIHALYVC